MAKRKGRNSGDLNGSKKRKTPHCSEWNILPIPDVGKDREGHFLNTRLNSLGSLFWFTKHTLGKDKLDILHVHLCKSLEDVNLRLVMEVPMSHFKTTMGIGLSIWWALPFTELDEEKMRGLGYGNAWIRYMRLIHDQNTSTLITHEIAGQASAIGRGVDEAYQHNDLFRECFREILPDRGLTWNNSEKFHKRLPRGGDATTATFVYRGVGQALQGIHARNILQDDNYGREAQQSLLHGDNRVGRNLFEWHKQVGTRFDPNVKEYRRQGVLGNPWAHNDLNWWIKTHQPEFKFETHSAEGGCCDLHPPGQSILPSVWTMELLQKERARLEADGNKGDYEHFYLCMHTLPGEKTFDASWLHYFKFKQSRPDLKLEDLRNILLLEHEPDNGTVIEDFQPGGLVIRMIVDPHHAKKINRSEHVIWVVGYDIETTRIYLLSLWAEDTGYTEMVDEIYKTAKRWNLSDVWMGMLAHELLSFYLRQRDRTETFRLIVDTFPDDDSIDGMTNRIQALEPLFKNRQVWVHRGSQEKFVTQFSNYPAGQWDTLDVLGNFQLTVDVVSAKEEDEFIRRQRAQFSGRWS